MKVVSPFRFQAPESSAHRKLNETGEFDWLGAIAMHRETVRRATGAPSILLTDQASRLPEPLLRFETFEPRLMLWILEVSLAYVRSEHFDDDTVFMSPDILCFHPLQSYFDGAALGVVVRPGERWHKRPLLNSVQFWPVSARHFLISFFTVALEKARALPASQIEWGADTTPLVQMLEPIVAGMHRRCGRVVHMIDHAGFLYSPAQWDTMAKGGKKYADGPRGCVDFKYLAKLRMRDFYARHVE